MTKLPIPKSYWVEEGRFLAGEHPGGFDLETARRRMDAFLEAGMDTFIDLTQPHERVPYDSVLKEEARIYEVDAAYHRFGIQDYTVPTHEAMTAILDTIDDALEAGRKVYVHCWGGVGRTGMVVGCYLVRHGMTNEQAVLQVNKLYKTRPDSAYFPRSPESDEQVNFILYWWEDPEQRHKRNQNFCEG